MIDKQIAGLYELRFAFL